MKCAVLILYVVAFLFQVIGAAGVIQDVRTSIRNMRQLKVDLTEAEVAEEDHRRLLVEVRNKPRAYGLQEAMGRLVDVVGEAAVDRTGAAPAIQRRALVKYVTAQNDISDLRRWGAVGLLLGGLVVGFIGNLLSLHP